MAADIQESGKDLELSIKSPLLFNPNSTSPYFGIAATAWAVT